MRRDRTTRIDPEGPNTHPPPASYRRFLYLDSQQILESLSAIQGGNVEDAVEQILNSGEGNLGVSISVGGKGLEIGSKSARSVKREIRLRQTVHSSVSALLHTLGDEVQRPTRAPDHEKGLGEFFEALEENQLVEFKAVLHLCRSALMKRVVEREMPSRQQGGWLARLTPRWGSKREEEEEDRRWRVRGIGQGFVAFATPLGRLGDPIYGDPPLILRLDTQHLLIEPEDFQRQATVVAQVEIKPLKGERVFLEGRAGRTIPKVEKLRKEEPTPDRFKYLADFSGSLFADDDGDISTESVGSNSLVLRPVCIYR